MLNLQNIQSAKNRLNAYDPTTFHNVDDSFRFFLNGIKVVAFRHITDLPITFSHPVTVITGTNKIGKTSILLLIACSFENFMKYDSTKPETEFRKHIWRDVISFTSYETAMRDYSYTLQWRVGNQNLNGEGKRLRTSGSWSGLGKSSQDPRKNAKIKEREVRLVDLERLLPVRSFSASLLRKISLAAKQRVNEDIEKAFAYILEIPGEVEISRIGSHINKIAHLIERVGDTYSSSNAASGEESLINVLTEIIETPKDSLILIDEIEAGLHPRVQRRLADIIQYISWRDKKQFILTTHSPSFLSALPQKSRVFIERNEEGSFKAIPKISVNATFSKMDSEAYPLVRLYCEDKEAKFIIKKIIQEIGKKHIYFDRLINVVTSGAINVVKNDYLRHKANYPKMRLKVGYCCVFDGDHKDHSEYSTFHNNPTEFSFFLYPYEAPEKFLVRSYLADNNNAALNTALTYSDHHALFEEMVTLGIAVDRNDARNKCWDSFAITPAFRTLKVDLEKFLIDTVTHFSNCND